jgi:hypothetical protein
LYCTKKLLNLGIIKMMKKTTAENKLRLALIGESGESIVTEKFSFLMPRGRAHYIILINIDPHVSRGRLK